MVLHKNRSSALSFLAAALLLGFSHHSHAKPAMNRPAPLRPGDTIQLIAPAGAPQEKRVRLAAERLEALGYIVLIPEGFFERTGYIAGDDDTRAAELNAAFADPDVDAVFPVAGGFGTTRILNQLDYDTIAANPKPFIGFSDITGLHLAFHKKANLVTFHSPNPQWGLGSKSGMNPFAEKTFWRALLGPGEDQDPGSLGYTIDPAADNPEPKVKIRAVAGGQGTGQVIGGNLALVTALMGTPYEIETQGKILFLEDVNEAPYRVDRMLRTLKDAGKLDGLAGVVLGRFTKGEADEKDGHTIDDVFDDYFADAPYPVLAHFPAGHVSDNATIPFGVPATLDADTQTLRFNEEPTRAAD